MKHRPQLAKVIHTPKAHGSGEAQVPERKYRRFENRSLIVEPASLDRSVLPPSVDKCSNKATLVKALEFTKTWLLGDGERLDPRYENGLVKMPIRRPKLKIGFIVKELGERFGIGRAIEFGTEYLWVSEHSVGGNLDVGLFARRGPRQGEGVIELHVAASMNNFGIATKETNAMVVSRCNAGREFILLALNSGVSASDIKITLENGCAGSRKRMKITINNVTPGQVRKFSDNADIFNGRCLYAKKNGAYIWRSASEEFVGERVDSEPAEYIAVRNAASGNEFRSNVIVKLQVTQLEERKALELLEGAVNRR